MTTKPAQNLTAGDTILNPATGQPTHVLHVDQSPYLKSDIDVQTTAGDYSANADFTVTVLD